MTTRQAGEVLGVAVRTVQLWVEAGVLPAWRTAGGHRRIARSAVERLLKERQRGLMPDSAKEVAPSSDGQPTAASQSSADSTANGAQSATSAPHAMRILLVEDDANMAEIFAGVVAQWGMPIELTTAINGFDGLLRMGEKRPDVLVTDLLMPGMDGFEMLRNLKNTGGRFQHVKVLVVSALSMEEVEARGGLPEGVVFFQKPLRYAKLETVVRKHYADQILLDLAGTHP